MCLAEYVWIRDTVIEAGTRHKLVTECLCADLQLAPFLLIQHQGHVI